MRILAVLLLGTALLARTAAAAAPPPPLQVEARQAAAGDIPDNQVFITYRGAGYTIKYPEGWAQSGKGRSVTFRDKNNVIRIVIQPGHHAAGRTSYRTKSAPNPVTGKRVTLAVVRYFKPKGARTAVLDLGGPVGVDNVDAYRLIARSFRWR